MNARVTRPRFRSGIATLVATVVPKAVRMQRHSEQRLQAGAIWG